MMNITEQEFDQRYTYKAATDKLGEGGFGSVFKAYDNHRDRWVALKIAKVNPQYENIRLRKEVEMVAKLPSHPNIAYYEECYTFPQRDGEYDFGILQYYEEGNLMQLLKNNTLQLSQKISLLSQILDGIAFLHNNGIIHRDLKPQNILIVRRGNEYIPKITDFGISKQLDINKSSIFSNSIAGAGTLAYASPEQLGEREIRKNTDLWSFGVIAFQTLTGKLPFTTGEHASTSEAGRTELFRQINSGKLPKEIDAIPEPWQTLIQRCLVIDPAQRAKNTDAIKDILANDGNDKGVARNASTENDNADEATRFDPPSISIPTSLNNDFSSPQPQSQSQPKPTLADLGKIAYGWYKKCFKPYVNFEGRARRKEYWFFTLFSGLYMIGLSISILFLSDFGIILLAAYFTWITIPALGVTVRRMHDTGRSGWYCLIPFAGFVFTLLNSQSGTNKWGDNPKLEKTA